jgi:hypothetical protein
MVISTAATKRATTFQYIRDIADALHALPSLDAEPLKRELIDFYQHKRPELSVEARSYLRFLDLLDMLALAYAEDAVDRSTVRRYLRPLLRDSGAISLPFIDEMRQTFKDQSVYEHLQLLASDVRRGKA